MIAVSAFASTKTIVLCFLIASCTVIVTIGRRSASNIQQGTICLIECSACRFINDDPSNGVASRTHGDGLVRIGRRVRLTFTQVVPSLGRHVAQTSCGLLVMDEDFVVVSVVIDVGIRGTPAIAHP